MRCDPSEERLNAFIDGELTPADAATLLEQLRTDAALRERVSQLRLSKELVRHAYAYPAPPSAAAPKWSGTRRWHAAAAGLVALTCGALLGWGARDQAGGASGAPLQLAERGDSTQILLHLSGGSAQQGRVVLDRAESLLETARAEGRRVAVEIVANGDGLDLLREGVSAHAARIAQLRATHPNLALVACGQTAQRLRDGGVDVKLLPGTSTASSALDEIVTRMQQGWAYTKI